MNIDLMLPVVREHLVTIGDDARLVEAAALLSGHRVELLVVCDRTGKVAGVITRKDIVSRIGRCEGSACVASVASAMSRNVVHCHPGDTLQAPWTASGKAPDLTHPPRGESALAIGCGRAEPGVL